MAYTTSNLISAVERRSFSPANSETFSQAEILAIASEELQSTIIPALINLREDFLVITETTSITANTSEYAIPTRAYSGLIREVKLTRGNQIKDLYRMESDQITTTRTGIPEAFYLKGNNIVLYPTPGSADHSLRVDYFLTPQDLVLPSATAIITAINTSTNVVSFSSIPDTFTTGASHDFIKANGEHVVISVDNTNTLVSGTDITFSSLPSDLAVGDYVSLAGENSLISLPVNMRNVLAQMTAARLLIAQSAEGARESYQIAEKMLQDAIKVLNPRVQGAVRHLLPKTWL